MQVDFYLFDSSAPLAITDYVCRYLNKAYEAKMRIFVLASSAEQAQAIDSSLWTTSDVRFIPHSLFDQEPQADDLNTICIGTALPKPSEKAPPFDLLLRLQSDDELMGEGFSRVAEFVSSDETHKAAARKRYAAWRSQNAALKLHNIKLH